MHDVIVVGGGHAGVEAAAAAARLGCHTLLLTADLSRVGQMSCNPAIGGVAKGTVAREVDALGGIMGKATDSARIHFRMLNRSKGPAVWGPRAQCDRGLYARAVRALLERVPRLELYQDTVVEIRVKGGGEGPLGAGERFSVETAGGSTFRAAAVVVTAGTFLRGRIHVGRGGRQGGGRAGEPPADRLAESLAKLGLEASRFKTGTPPRVDGRTVNFDRLTLQEGDPEDFRFSSYTREEIPPQRPCWMTWAGEALKRVVRENLELSALYGGAISGRGPRYCPSIEDKIVRFPAAERHQVFLEPEGLDTEELYVNGLSTSLPPDVQRAFLRTVPGLEEARMTRPGYAIEYDFFPPSRLRRTLEVKQVPGLFLAGQVNGTTGYEEAAGQGVVAGANAALKVLHRPAFLLERDQAFIGVLIDDLVLKGVDEPYRLFTSRAEFRLILRQDNALRRLGPLAREVGLLGSEEAEILEARLELEDAVREWFLETALRPEQANPVLLEAGSSEIEVPARAGELLKRPGVRAERLARAGDAPFLAQQAEDALAAVDVEVKYAGYVEREAERVRRLRDMAAFELSPDLCYQEFHTLSTEARQKLDRAKPANLAEAGRIPGVSPADLQNLVMEVRRRVSAVRRAEGR